MIAERWASRFLPPDVNESNLDFTVIDKNTIRFWAWGDKECR
jgi:DNA polymerase III alpha subunit